MSVDDRTIGRRDELALRILIDIFPTQQWVSGVR